MKKQEKQILIESLKEGLKDLSQENKVWYAHGYLSVNIKSKDITYKDYYDIINAIVKYDI